MSYDDLDYAVDMRAMDEEWAAQQEAMEEAMEAVAERDAPGNLALCRAHLFGNVWRCNRGASQAEC